MRKKVTERRPLSQIASARAFYPKYFEDYDIQADMDMVEQARRYDDYRDMGGFLDKLTYFEVKSITRATESREDMNRFRKPTRRPSKSIRKNREQSYQDFNVKDDVRIPGTPFVVEKGDVLRVYPKGE